MKSKFTYKCFLFPVLTIWLIIISSKIIIDNYPIDLFNLRWIDYFMTILFSVTLVWLIKFEILRKMVFFEISESYFTTKNILCNKRICNYSDLIGYETQINSTRLGNFEETIIMTNDNRKIIISELFIANYKELKREITHKLKNYGGERKNAP